MDFENGASTTAAEMIDGLVEFGYLDESGVLNLLGQDRHDVALNDLELRILEKNVLSPQRLLELKGTLSGLDILDDPKITVDADALSEEVVRLSGAFVLNLPDLVVAMVEDLPELRELVAEQLGTWEYTVWAIHAGQFDDLYQRFYAGGEVAEARQLPEDVWAVLDQAVIRNASDIHMSVGEQPAVRIDGSIVRLHTAPLTADWCREEFRRLAGEERFETLEALNDVDFAITFGAARFRVNLGADRRGFTAALRKIPTKIPQIADLGLPPSLVDYVCGLDRGLVLVTGPTGSGKSTTNAALLAELAARYPKHILTLEDPVEYVLPSGRAMVHQRELGESFDSFDTGLRQALRQDPDVILVGELRDPETMETALHAAETGHLVFGTLHTVDAASTVARLVSSFPSDVQDHVRAQLAYILKAVVSQTLLPLRNAKGRVAAFEIMTSNPAIASNLRKVDGHVQLRQAIETARGEGMQTLEMHLAELVLAGTVAEDVAALKAPNLDDFHRRLAAE